jgi:hypothetical protein
VSTAQVKLALRSVITATVPTVVVLKGKWGRGKTYLWKDALRKFAGAAPDRWTRYSYVSLFGVETLAELRDAVLANGDDWEQVVAASRPPDPNEQPPDILQRSVSRVRTSIARAMQQTDDLTALAGKLNAGGLAHALLLRGVRDYLICVDDLERRGTHLRLRDVLGYLATLRDDRHCSVLVILNTDELSPEDRDEFDRMREKVFDHEVAFDPSAGESAELVFPKEDPTWDTLRGNCLRLGIENVRVLQRIRRSYERLLKELSLPTEAAERRLGYVVPLVALCHYSREPYHPPMAYLRARMRGEPGHTAAFDAYLEAYDGWQPSAVDAVVAEYLERGYVDRHALAEALRPADGQ